MKSQTTLVDLFVDLRDAVPEDLRSQVEDIVTLLQANQVDKAEELYQQFEEENADELSNTQSITGSIRRSIYKEFEPDNNPIIPVKEQTKAELIDEQDRIVRNTWESLEQSMGYDYLEQNVPHAKLWARQEEFREVAEQLNAEIKKLYEMWLEYSAE